MGYWRYAWGACGVGGGGSLGGEVDVLERNCQYYCDQLNKTSTMQFSPFENLLFCPTKTSPLILTKPSSHTQTKISR